jgi:hypothetical protein
MMMQPEDVRTSIRFIAVRFADQLGYEWLPPAIGNLSEVPDPYGKQTTIDIDPMRLDGTVLDLSAMTILQTKQRLNLDQYSLHNPNPGTVLKIEEDDLLNARKNFPCHYLWFC